MACRKPVHRCALSRTSLGGSSVFAECRDSLNPERLEAAVAEQLAVVTSMATGRGRLAARSHYAYATPVARSGGLVCPGPVAAPGPARGPAAASLGPRAAQHGLPHLPDHPP